MFRRLDSACWNIMLEYLGCIYGDLLDCCMEDVYIFCYPRVNRFCSVDRIQSVVKLGLCKKKKAQSQTFREINNQANIVGRSQTWQPCSQHSL